MPISPDNLPLYPGGSIKSPEWLAIRAQIQDRADDCCEGCGVENGLIGIRLPDRGFMELPGYIVGDRVVIDYQMGAGMTLPIVGVTPQWSKWEARVFRVVCTVAHVDRGLTDHSPDNLRFWCQQCHNRHDAPARAARAAATRAANKPKDLIDWMGAANDLRGV